MHKRPNKRLSNGEVVNEAPRLELPPPREAQRSSVLRQQQREAVLPVVHLVALDRRGTDDGLVLALLHLLEGRGDTTRHGILQNDVADDDEEELIKVAQHAPRGEHVLRHAVARRRRDEHLNQRAAKRCGKAEIVSPQQLQTARKGDEDNCEERANGEQITPRDRNRFQNHLKSKGARDEDGAEDGEDEVARPLNSSQGTAQLRRVLNVRGITAPIVGRHAARDRALIPEKEARARGAQDNANDRVVNEDLAPSASIDG